jgi:malate dehydrogenase
MEESCVLKRTDCRAKGGAPGFKVAILGAAGGIGQPLAMLMKMNHLVSVLHLYDVVNAPGVTADISHMDTGAVVIYESIISYVFLFNILNICGHVRL